MVRMNELKKLMKETFELWVRRRWLKEVNKACDKYIKTKEKIDKKFLSQTDKNTKKIPKSSKNF